MLNFLKSASPLALTTLATLATLACACGDTVAATESATTTASSTTTEPVETTATTEPATTTGQLMLVCEPGQERCGDATTREVCKPTGLEWEPQPCSTYQACNEQGGEPTVAECLGPCEKASDSPTSVGCEFLAIRIRSGNSEEDLAEFFDAVLVGNPDPLTATVQMYFTPNSSSKEEPLGDPVVLKTGESTVFKLTSSFIKGFSAIREGGIYRVKSDIPVIAYLHSPLKNADSNDSSMLLPVKSLRQDYVVASYPGYFSKPEFYGGRPSYFNVIALENATTVTWTPPVITAGNGLAPQKVLAGEVGSVKLNRFALMQIGASTENADGTPNADYKSHDISGTVIHADKPIWLLSGTACAPVPYGSTSCNHLQEQMIPIEYWGTKYVAAPAPLRGTEKSYWRVYAGEDGINITVDPPGIHPVIPLARRGDFKEMEVTSGQGFTFYSTGPFMPVQYLASNKVAGGIGDPAMYQTIPIEQYLKRYVFITGIDYTFNYAQVVHAFGAAPIKINGVEVTADQYKLINSPLPLGRFYVANVPIESSTLEDPKFYTAESDDPFSLSVIGYVGENNDGKGSAYAYPGGMALNVITEL